MALPMTLFLVIVLTPSELDDGDLFGTIMGKHFSLDLTACDVGRAYFDALAISQHENLVKDDFCTGCNVQFFQAEDFSLSHPVLLATAFDYRKGHSQFLHLNIRHLDVFAHMAFCNQRPDVVTLRDLKVYYNPRRDLTTRTRQETLVEYQRQAG